MQTVWLSVTVRDGVQVVFLILFGWFPGKTQDLLKTEQLIFLWENQQPQANNAFPSQKTIKTVMWLSFSHNMPPWEHKKQVLLITQK